MERLICSLIVFRHNKGFPVLNIRWIYDIYYQIAIWWKFENQSGGKKFKLRNEFLEQSLNIEYQCGLYSV